MTDGQARVFIGLGGNIGDRLATLRSAIAAVNDDAVPQTTVRRVSAVYETRAVGPSSEPFLNAVAELTTTLRPCELLSALLAVETDHGRTRLERWAARTLDLDVLLWFAWRDERWHSQVIDEDGLQVPHPRARQRDFVLRPLADLLKAWPMDDGQSLESLVNAVPDDERTVTRRLHDTLP
ncbi:MAG: 2-amino-4-hydroxy-6-hydroxymethyldihydropteridine diphosphokinase [Nannocystaceae bacterium]|nr:2-amino-4-hydroxy-6-hydroxymethyldihydropteridine diphosphokinase [Nannocystaceae bacterium]